MDSCLENSLGILMPIFFFGAFVLAALEYRLCRDLWLTIKVVIGLKQPTKQYITDLSIVLVGGTLVGLYLIVTQCTG